MKKEELKNKNFLDALKNALNGIVYDIISQKNSKIQLVIGIIAIILGIYLKLSKVEFMILILSIFIVFIAETFNTAIETVVDLYTKEYNKKAKIAKDVGAGAVLLAAINSCLIGGILFIEKIINVFVN